MTGRCALLVKADDVSRARLKLAAAGVSPTDGNIGFEILDKDQGLGTSQFMEATRYRRGLEGELARLVKEQARPGDMVVCLGAGTISTWANALPAKLMGAAA